MRVLVLHSEDELDRGPWVNTRWDRVVDCAIPQNTHYRSQSAAIHSSIEGLPDLKVFDLHRTRQVLSLYLNRLCDQKGFDWWDLLSLRYYEQLHQVFVLREFASTCASGDQVFVSRAGLQSSILERLLPGQIRTFRPSSALVRRLRKFATAAWQLKPGELLQVAGDKYDARYRVRNLIAPRRKAGARQSVLLPSAYLNATRAAICYANRLPDVPFLLVATRRSGWMNSPPGNVNAAWLASYASGQYPNGEYHNLLANWRELVEQFSQEPDMRLLKDCGVFSSAPSLIKQGITIRDAWLEVFRREQIASVLCPDEGNPYTRIPLLIARQHSVPAVACHHGALDLRHAFRATSADIILAKGKMEEDYLIKFCGMDKKKVTISAPPRPSTSRQVGLQRRFVVFFSEPYEAIGGRAELVYRQILPHLAETAKVHDRKLVIKLHPFESFRGRKALVRHVLEGINLDVRIIDAPLSEALLQECWFGVTVSSTAAMDCALNGVPAFLCTWLARSTYSYTEQFVKFRIAEGLYTPDQIAGIPQRLESVQMAAAGDLWQASHTNTLRDLLLPAAQPGSAVAPEFALENA